MNNLVTVKVCGSRIEATIAKSVLDSAGIRSIIAADDAGGYYPPTILSKIELKVNEKDEDKAKKLLK